MGSKKNGTTEQEKKKSGWREGKESQSRNTHSIDCESRSRSSVIIVEHLKLDGIDGNRNWLLLFVVLFRFQATPRVTIQRLMFSLATDPMPTSSFRFCLLFSIRRKMPMKWRKCRNSGQRRRKGWGAGGNGKNDFRAFALVLTPLSMCYCTTRMNRLGALVNNEFLLASAASINRFLFQGGVFNRGQKLQKGKWAKGMRNNIGESNVIG